jgi:hypothetical protein
MEPKAVTRDIWSKPIQATIENPMDRFQVRIEDGVELQIRFEKDGNVSVYLSAFDHPSYFKTKTMPFLEFAEAIGQAFFGSDWRKSK